MGFSLVSRRQLLLALALSACVWSAHAINPFRFIDVLNSKREDENGASTTPPTNKAPVPTSTPPLVRILPPTPMPTPLPTFVPTSQPTRTLIRTTPSGDIDELYLEQRLDHFSSGSDTFQQRYFCSKRYAGNVSRLNAPTYAFLCVGGEGPSLDKSVLVDSVHCSGDMIELARLLHENNEAIVHLFAIEHRYYGKSYPEFKDNNGDSQSPVTNENLAYLSSRQALADLAHFVDTMNDSHGLLNAKWVTFGGSYPGMLAAWARLEYPSRVHAAVSNSAPIHMQVDFGAYKDRVAYDLQYPLVGGSQECLKVVMDGHEAIVNALSAGKHEDIARMFQVCDPDSLRFPENQRLFAGDGVITTPAQGNDPHCDKDETCSIKKLCDVILREHSQSTPLEVLAKVAMMQKEDDSCLRLDWNSTLSFLSSPHAQKGGVRSWLWQTCTEFGFYQTCQEDSLCPFARGLHPLEMDLEICEQAFDIDREAVVANVEQSRKHYGGWDIDALRIFSVNGDVDPWSMLALTSTDRDELPAHWVKGASHHYWTHPVKDSDGQEVRDARDLIYLKVMQWLEEDSEFLGASDVQVREDQEN